MSETDVRSTNQEEMNNQQQGLPVNTIGNTLTEDLMQRSAQHTISTVNRAEQIEHELFSLPFHIQNFDWNQFCAEHNSDIQIVQSNFEQELTENQILLSETKTFQDKTRVIISDPTHLIPNVENADTFEFKTYSTKQVNNKGVMIVQDKGTMGIMTYLSFLPGKKIYGLFVKDNPEEIKQFYFVGNISTSDIIPNISLPPDLVPRDLNSPLSENDKIIIANSSSRFKNKVSSLSTLKQALKYFNKLLGQTVDPAYMNKLMLLNKTLSFQS